MLAATWDGALENTSIAPMALHGACMTAREMVKSYPVHLVTNQVVPSQYQLVPNARPTRTRQKDQLVPFSNQSI